MGTKSVGLRRLHAATAAGLGMVAGVIAAVAAQRGTLDAINRRLERLEEQAGNQQRANLAMQQRQHWELLSKAIDDPELAEVLDYFEAAGGAPMGTPCAGVAAGCRTGGA
ncbi:DUF6082 family protein, partial [Streptomyces althioticus]|uniref:DUF6082 family protein n=1 Tax=Streptomyces althioticus TaxID=83380 RepID=UPI0033FA8CC8